MAGLLGSKKHRPMSRQESSVWLGRAMTTSAVTLQAIMKIIPMVALQQHVIQSLYEQHPSKTGEATLPEPLQQLESGVSQEILAKLSELEAQLGPLMKVVDEACAKLQKEI